jgi:hypothetical protein
MRRLARVLAAAGLFASAGVIALTAGAGPASAGALPIDQCTTTSGVILAVDFGPWGGPVLRACGSTPTTGYALLNEGGWHTTGTGHDGPGFICRIAFSGYQGGAAYPTAAQDACVVTPPASAYWSYWHADPGQNSWTYSSRGAMLYQPVSGSVDSWVFGAGNAPPFSPDSVRATNAAPPESTTRPAAPQPTHAAPPPPTHAAPQPPAQPGASARDSAAGAVPGAARTTTGTPGSAATTGAGPPTPGPGLTSQGSGPPIVDVGPTTASRSSAGSGSPLPVLAGVGIVALVGSAAGFTAWRRRRAR